MGSSCLFIDTNIGIERVFNEEYLSQKIEDFVDRQELLTSEYVVGEFVRTVLFDCCSLHSMVMEEENLNDVYRRIKKMMDSGEDDKERVGARYDLILKSLSYPSDPEREQTLTNLSNLIRFYLLPSFTQNLKIIESNTECVLDSCHPKKRSGSYEINIPCIKTSETASCRLSSFVNDSMDILESISNQLDQLDNNEPYYLELIDLIDNFSSEENLDLSIEECKILGDVIVTLDCPETCTIMSKDHHIKELCKITGQEYQILD